MEGGKIKIKVCGMRDADNIVKVSALAPDFMGFIFYHSSPRYVGSDFRLPERSASHTTHVGVFVNADNSEIMKQAKKIGFDHVQLHGDESVAQAGLLKDAGFKVVKVFSVDDRFDFKITKPFIPVVDYFLFDTKGKFYGGNAKTFSWKLLDRYDQEVPFFLSGGLSPDNIDDVAALKGMNLFAVDVNSGVEESPGFKNLASVKAVFDAIERMSLKDLKKD